MAKANMRMLGVLGLLLTVAGVAWTQTPGEENLSASLVENAFQLGRILQDSNGDKIPDAVCANIIVPDAPDAAENTAAANLAGRIGYESTGITLPIVRMASAPIKSRCSTAVSLWVGQRALKNSDLGLVSRLLADLQMAEGGVFAVKGGLAFVAADPVGLIAASNAYAARAPYQWSVPGEKLESIAKTLNATFQEKHVDASAELIGLTYVEGQPGIHRALLQISGSADAAAIRKALNTSEEAAPVRNTSVRELDLIVGNGAPIALVSSVPSPGVTALPSIPEAPAEETRLLDLGTLYGIKGLLSGSPKKMIPSGVAAKLFVPGGARGVALANLAARIGLETTGMTLPVAVPASGVPLSGVKSPAVMAGNSQLVTHLEDLLGAPGGMDVDKILPGQYSQAKSVELPSLVSGEGELRVVDRAFGKSPALIVRGDEEGAAAAIDYSAQRLPFLWEPSKKFEDVEEIRDDLRKFFSLRSSAGQASVALYHLDKWVSELAESKQRPISSISAEIDVDEADPALAQFVRKQIETRLKPEHLEVKTGNLHAGIKCCAVDPPLHFESAIVPFQQAQPTFAEDLVIKWEGTRVLEAIRNAQPQIRPDDVVDLEARVSEGPEVRSRLRKQVIEELGKLGANQQRVNVQILSAYKQGYSWLVDQVAPALKGASVDKIRIEFAPYKDPENLSSMRSVSRWVQELYPVDEVLAKDLSLPLSKIEFTEMPDAKGPTYRVHAFSSNGNEILSREFTVTTFTRPYSPHFLHYEQVNVSTGWLKLEVAKKQVLNQRVPTDIEEFWEHYQSETLPRIFNFIMAQNEGKPKTEYQPLFDTLKISVKMSEPEFDIGVDQERISSLEALQEDTLFSTQNFFYMMGDLVANGMMDYQGRVLPVVYQPIDGQDGHVRIEFYGKDAGYPQVRLTWRSQGEPTSHERVRKLPALSFTNPRLVAARIQSGQIGVKSLTWKIHADSQDDQYKEWIKLVPQEQVEHTVFSAAQGAGQLAWLERMHAAGMYRDSLAYPRLGQLEFQFELPPAPWAAQHAKSEVVAAAFSVAPPVTPRPQIVDFVPAPVDSSGHFVSWDRPIGPSEEEHLLSRLSTYPGVNVYWMGRTYLGRNIWAADIMLPTPSMLVSTAKETTLKAALIYSGRQHANEVSSTSHILKLAELLVTDAKTREALSKVNVVVHPITNVDGAELAMDLAKITPKNMLHPGYHASLTADLSTAQWDEDPLYPESSTRRQLWQSWLPDAFLNPHGYPSHEWVQPFSEYAAWVITRFSAESGRAWWIPRGWFTSLGYLDDDDHRSSKTVAFAIRDKIVDGMSSTPGVLEMNRKMNERYERYGQRWDEKNFQQPIYKGVRIYMAVKGQTPSPRAPSFMARYPDVTYDDGYTEAPDETAYGDWLHLVSSAGLAYDKAHLDYFAQSKYKIKRTQKEFFDGVQWKVDRERPVLPEAQQSESSAELQAGHN